jgi:hypothetical protein
MEGTNQFRSNHGTRQFQELFQVDENLELLAKAHACRSSKRILEQANDRLKRANRDLGETAAFIAASLTTVTAVHKMPCKDAQRPRKISTRPSAASLSFALESHCPNLRSSDPCKKQGKSVVKLLHAGSSARSCSRLRQVIW